MQIESVLVKCNVYVKWKQGDPPRYRCFVNDELFTERTWVWGDNYLEEYIPIRAEPGQYAIHYKLVNPEYAQIEFANLHVEKGPAVIDREGSVKIYGITRTE
jgi:hypothetical protein